VTAQRPVIVLVPGAWHLPSTYDLLRAELDKLGYASLAVKLPTNGPAPRGGLHDDAQSIRAAIVAIGGPVVVVAHSYAGLPVTEGAANLPNVQHLVYVAAYLPEVGESMYSLHDAPEPETMEELFHLTRDPREQLYHDLPEELAEQATSQLVDQRRQPFTDRVTQAAWHTIPSTYILTENDASLPVEFQNAMAARAKNIRRIPTAHSPHLARPAELAALLDEIIRG